MKQYFYTKLARIVLYAEYLGRRFRNEIKNFPRNRKTIVFLVENDDLYRHDMGRYPYLLLNKFSKSGYSVYFYKNVDTFQKYLDLGKYGRFIYSIPGAKVIAQLPEHFSTENSLFAFDAIHEALLHKKWGKLIYVNMCKPVLCQVGNVVWIPYSFHPTAFKSGIDKAIEHLRANARRLRIIFVGNSVAKGYSLKKLKDRYNKLTRYEGVTAVLEIQDRVKNVEDAKEFCKAIQTGSYINECRLLRTDRAVKLDVRDYWDIVSRSDFFLGLSGTDYPMCHNVIESMSIGTIPVLGYGEWFFPPLEHGKNAVIYSDVQDLKAKIYDVLNMDERSIRRMRGHVIEYYETHLTSQSFVSKVETNQDKVMTLMLHPRLVCTPKDDEAGKQFMRELGQNLAKIDA